ncbi:hypothetical protein M2342_003373 [Sphingobium sp. B8D3A]|nr:hypothetical protein [Sphingobium sp. B8D3A]
MRRSPRFSLSRLIYRPAHLQKLIERNPRLDHLVA